MLTRDWNRVVRFSPPARPSSTPGGRPSRRAEPGCERLEGVRLLSTLSPVVAGTVFTDSNQNGRLDPGEKGVPGTQLQLKNSAGAVVASATTNDSGGYSFSTDSTLSTAPRSSSQSLTVPQQYTNIDSAPFGSTVAPFNPSLGRLVDVKIQVKANVTSWLSAENRSDAPSVISGSVQGTYHVDGLGGAGRRRHVGINCGFQRLGLRRRERRRRHERGNLRPARREFDEDRDVELPRRPRPVHRRAGPVRHRAATASVSASAALSATSGKADYNAATMGSVQLTVTYDYVPSNALKPGTYTIVRLPLISGGTLSPGPASLTVNLNATGSVNDNFALRPSVNTAVHALALPVSPPRIVAMAIPAWVPPRWLFGYLS